MSGVVFAASSCRAFTGTGVPVTMHVDEPWAADDPFVIAHPEFFVDVPSNRVLKRTVAPVEDASAVPGARRSTRRG